jgi:hypothetical protein
MNEQTNFNLKQWLQSPVGLVSLTLLSIAAFFLITEYTVHIFGALPYLFLMLCPLIHIFMHSRHESHGKEKRKNHSEQETNASEEHCH